MAPKRKTMYLPGGYLREIVEHAREGSPNEICGLIAGVNGRPVKLYRTTNNDPNPRVRFNVEPMELLEALREMEDNGWDLLSIYHSHPMSEAYPSATDIALCHYSNAVYIIVSLMGQVPEVRAFNIKGKKVTELDLVIEEEAGQRIQAA
jgi:proteasome lid subunit RPN8/RPN11